MLSARKRRRLGALHHARGRARHGAFLIEGPRVVAEALAASWPLEEALFEDGVDTPLVRRVVRELEARGVPLTPVTGAELASVADTVTPQAVLAVAALPEAASPERRDLEAALDQSTGPVLVVAGVQDPGNVGALLRTADAYAVSPVLLLVGTCDPWAPKVVRGAMGAQFHLRVMANLAAGTVLEALRHRGLRVLAAEARGGTDPGTLAAAGRVALLVGGEGGGLPPALAARAHGRVTIPTPGRAESLNVVVATGILLDRLTGRKGPERSPGPS